MLNQIRNTLLSHVSFGNWFAQCAIGNHVWVRKAYPLEIKNGNVTVVENDQCFNCKIWKYY